MMALLMGVSTVSAKALMRDLQQPGALALFDVNSIQRWRDGHIPGARHLDHGAFTQADLPAERDLRLVFYCSNPLCRKAPQAARRARAMGYRNVQVLAAGIVGWTDAGLPVEPAAEQAS